MKKIVSVAFVLLLSIMIVACGRNDNETPEDDNDQIIVDNGNQDDEKGNIDDDDHQDENGETDDVEKGPIVEELTLVYDTFQTKTIVDFSELEDFMYQTHDLGGVITFVSDDVIIISDEAVSVLVLATDVYNNYRVGEVVEVSGYVRGTYPENIEISPYRIRRINKTMDVNETNRLSVDTFDDFQYNHNTVQSIGHVFQFTVYYDENRQQLRTLYSGENPYLVNIDIINIKNYKDLLTEYANQTFEIDLVLVKRGGGQERFIIVDPNITPTDQPLLKKEAELSLVYSAIYASDFYTVGDVILDFELPFNATIEWDFADIKEPAHWSVNEVTIDEKGKVLDNFSVAHSVNVDGTFSYAGETFPITVHVNLLPEMTFASIDALILDNESKSVIIEGVVYEGNYIYDETNFIRFSYPSNNSTINDGDTIKIYGYYDHAHKRIDVYQVEASDESFDYPTSSQTVSVGDLTKNHYPDGSILTLETYLKSVSSIDEYWYKFTFIDKENNTLNISSSNEVFLNYENQLIRFNVLFRGEGQVRFLDEDFKVDVLDGSEFHVDVTSSLLSDITIARYPTSKPLPKEGLHGTTLTWISTEPDVLNDEGDLVGVIEDITTVAFDLVIEKGGLTETVSVYIDYIPEDVTNDPTLNTAIVLDNTNSYQWLLYDGRDVFEISIGTSYQEVNELTKLFDIDLSTIKIGDEIKFFTFISPRTGDLFMSQRSIKIIEQSTIDWPAGEVIEKDEEILMNLDEGMFVQLEGVLKGNNQIEFNFENPVTEEYKTIVFSLSTRQGLANLTNRYVNVTLFIEVKEEQSSSYVEYHAIIIDTPKESNHQLNVIMNNLVSTDWITVGNQITLPTPNDHIYQFDWDFNTSIIDDTGKLLIDNPSRISSKVFVTVTLGNDSLSQDINFVYLNLDETTNLSDINRGNHLVAGVIVHVFGDHLFIYDESGMVFVQNNSNQSFTAGDTIVAYGYVNTINNELPILRSSAIASFTMDASYEIPPQFDTLNFASATELLIGDQFILDDELRFKDFVEDGDYSHFIFEDINSSRQLTITLYDETFDKTFTEDAIYRVTGSLLFLGIHQNEHMYVTLDDLSITEE